MAQESSSSRKAPLGWMILLQVLLAPGILLGAVTLFIIVAGTVISIGEGSNLLDPNILGELLRVLVILILLTLNISAWFLYARKKYKIGLGLMAVSIPLSCCWLAFLGWAILKMSV